jgi:hypothetical protein
MRREIIVLASNDLRSGFEMYWRLVSLFKLAQSFGPQHKNFAQCIFDPSVVLYVGNAINGQINFDVRCKDQSGTG